MAGFAPRLPTRTILLLAAALAAVIAWAETADDLILIQQRVVRLDRPSVGEEAGQTKRNRKPKALPPKLPDVDQVSSKSAEVLRRVAGHVGDLERQLAEVQKKNNATITRQKRDYERQLSNQKSEIRATKTANAHLSADIAGLDASIGKLRGQAAKLTKEHEVLVDELRSLQSNISIALEFADKSLDSVAELENSTALQVLAHLSEKEAAEKAEQLHRHNLNLIEQSEGLSFLEIGIVKDAAQGKDDSPQNLVSLLASALDDLSIEQEASETSLRHMFEKEFQAGVELQHALLEEQEKLNATKMQRSELNQRLVTAVQYLVGRQRKMLGRRRSLRSFARRLGSTPWPAESEGVALLQVQQERSLPSVPKMASTHGEVLKHLSALEQRMTEMQEERAAAVASQRSEYERRLRDQRQDLEATEEAKANLAAEIEKLDESIADLRKKGDALIKKNKRMRDELQTLLSNVSLATEFTDRALEAHHAMLRNSSALQVLDDLQAEEDEALHRRSHQERLAEIAVGRGGQGGRAAAAAATPVPASSLLQVSAPDEPEESATRDILMSVASGLDDLVREQDASEESLKKVFEEAFQAGADRKAELLQEQANMQEIKTSKTITRGRLLVAVKHLEGKHAALLKTAHSLRVFARRLGMSEAKGVSLLQIQDGKRPSVLPDVSRLTSTHKTVVTQLNSQLSMLERRLAMLESQASHTVAAKRAHYEMLLRKQKATIERTERANARLAKKIQSLNESSTALRQHAGKLQEANAMLVADLRSMESNISTALEFVANTIESTEQQSHNTSALKVLSDLDERDQAERIKKSHERSLNLIEQSAGVSLLEVDSEKDRSTKEVGPKDLVSSVESALDDFAKERNATETSLRLIFEKESLAGDDRIKALLDEQAKLNATKASASERHGRLVAAVEHLEATRDSLLQRSFSLQKFVEHLAFAGRVAGAPSHAAGASFSLVQTAVRQLPGIKKVMDKPKAVFDAMSSQVSVLETRLLEAQQQNQEAVTRKKQEYEDILKEQENNNDAIRTQNRILSRRITYLNESNVNLRAMGDGLVVRNAKLRASLRRLAVNFSIAQEFAEKALENATNMLQDAPETQVLAELRLEEAEAEKKRQEEKRKMELLGFVNVATKEAPPSLVQIGAIASRLRKQTSVQPAELLATLSSTLSLLAEEQNTSEATLKEAFERERMGAIDKMKALLHQQARLNTSLAASEELHAKLQAAVRHLQATGNGLSTRIQALLGYANRIGSRAGRQERERHQPQKKQQQPQKKQQQPQKQQQHQRQGQQLLQQQQQHQHQKQTQHNQHTQNQSGQVAAKQRPHQRQIPKVELKLVEEKAQPERKLQEEDGKPWYSWLVR